MKTVIAALITLLCLSSLVSSSEKSVQDVNKEKVAALKKLLPEKDENEFGVWLDEGTPTMPFYVQLIKTSKGKVIVKRFHPDGSESKLEELVWRAPKIEFGNTAGDYYNLSGWKLSVWDEYGEIHKLTLIRKGRSTK